MTTFLVSDLVKVKGGWVANIEGFPWFMNRFGVLTSFEADPALAGALGSSCRSLKLADLKTTISFQTLIEDLGYKKHHDGRDYVFSQTKPKEPVHFVKDGYKIELFNRLKAKGLFNM